jgi:hypothetical protein
MEEELEIHGKRHRVWAGDMKPSELFEGENSSLRKTFDEAVDLAKESARKHKEAWSKHIREKYGENPSQQEKCKGHSIPGRGKERKYCIGICLS